MLSIVPFDKVVFVTQLKYVGVCVCVCIYIYIYDTRDYLISIGRCHTYYTQTGKLQISQKYECIKWKRKCSYIINSAIPLKEYV